jgi:eukaryotic translation initiation factor 2C
VKCGVATQCLKAFNCKGAKEQYWVNVLLKYVDTAIVPSQSLILAKRVNVKLGGVNVVLDPADSNPLNDPNNPTIVMGTFVGPFARRTKIITGSRR